MKKVLILGAGMVSGPIIRYLLNQPDIFVTVADIDADKAKKIIDNHPNGCSVHLDVTDDKNLEELISKADVTVSLLPYVFHVKVAKLCIANKKHLVTTSYVSSDMRQLDAKAKDAGVLLLNECGLDPGIDHMSVMRIIHDVEKKGGKIISFKSTTGALPSHAANTNPIGYKFSWSPKGVLLASNNDARWLKNGQIIYIPSNELFQHYSIQEIPGVGVFENYSNRDSFAYKKIYGLDDAHTVYRGTFRMMGWCETMNALGKLGWLKETSLNGFHGKSFKDLTLHLIGKENGADIITQVSSYLEVKPYAAVIKRLQWLGIFDELSLPKDKQTPIDVLNNLSSEKMKLDESEQDMIVMYHDFIIEEKGRKKHITSTLINYGIPKEQTAVSRTVALPAAIAVKLILNNGIALTGVHIPIQAEIYYPILNELETMDVIFKEKSEILNS
jgi:saccharopine dehydrogenase (NADP+, L-glutamate forming)